MFVTSLWARVVTIDSKWSIVIVISPHFALLLLVSRSHSCPEHQGSGGLNGSASHTSFEGSMSFDVCLDVDSVGFGASFVLP